jgi:hypothetical protein
LNADKTGRNLRKDIDVLDARFQRTVNRFMSCKMTAVWLIVVILQEPIQSTKELQPTGTLTAVANREAFDKRADSPS